MLHFKEPFKCRPSYNYYTVSWSAYLKNDKVECEPVQLRFKIDVHKKDYVGENYVDDAISKLLAIEEALADLETKKEHLSFIDYSNKYKKLNELFKSVMGDTLSVARESSFIQYDEYDKQGLLESLCIGVTYTDSVGDKYSVSTDAVLNDDLQFVEPSLV